MNSGNREKRHADDAHVSRKKPYHRPSITARERIETVAATCQGATAKALGDTSCQFLNS